MKLFKIPQIYESKMVKRLIEDWKEKETVELRRRIMKLYGDYKIGKRFLREETVKFIEEKVKVRKFVPAGEGRYRRWRERFIAYLMKGDDFSLQNEEL